MNANRQIRRERRTHLLGYAVLAALLLLQVGYASHLDEHGVGETVDDCELCLQLENNKNALAAEPAALASAPQEYLQPAAGTDRAAHQNTASCRARAPPSV